MGTYLEHFSRTCLHPDWHKLECLLRGRLSSRSHKEHAIPRNKHSKTLHLRRNPIDGRVAHHPTVATQRKIHSTTKGPDDDGDDVSHKPSATSSARTWWVCPLPCGKNIKTNINKYSKRVVEHTIDFQIQRTLQALLHSALLLCTAHPLITL